MTQLKKVLMSSMVFAGTTGTLLAQDSYGGSGGGGGGVIAGVAGLVFMLIMFAVLIIIIASMWKVFSKAGKPGWAAIVPIYNLIVLWQVSNQPVWALILCFIPYVNVIGVIFIALGVAKAFGKGAGFGIGLWLLPIIFYPILAFGDAEYQGA